jgi:polar amino acid transport system permease protein
MMAFDFSIVLRFKEALFYGLLTTLNLTLICIVLGCVLGFVIGLARSSNSRIL